MLIDVVSDRLMVTPFTQRSIVSGRPTELFTELNCVLSSTLIVRDIMEQHACRGSSLVKAIKSDAVKDVSKEYLELGLDSLLANDTLKSLSIVNTVVGICNFVGTVRDQVLAKKLLRFIYKLSELDTQERVRMLDKLNEDDKYAGKVGDAIIEIIDKVDSDIKPEIAAKFFIAYTKDLLSYNEFRHCIFSLEKVASFDIDKLPSFLEDQNFAEKYGESVLLGFVNAGLGVNNGGLDGGWIIPTKLCKSFVENALK